MASIPNGAFLAPHSCHDAMRKEMELKRLERQTSTTVTPDGTPPGSPRKYDPGSSPLANFKNFLWPSNATLPSPKTSRKVPEIIYSEKKPSAVNSCVRSSTPFQKTSEDHDRQHNLSPSLIKNNQLFKSI
ncbi:hypothetical protein BSL78_07140 [Apostichopus japonicus]|uniref:Uncharacterized protein n=1 Tax=Stichopus japonicus TaxID=307972 RepID=A0A2G8L6R4_STIJA|nr:hypothetical protein BSL78_07140 [Apostichopus japonicus]